MMSCYKKSQQADTIDCQSSLEGIG